LQFEVLFPYKACREYNFMKKSHFYEPLPIHENIFMEYVYRLMQYFYRIQFYEARLMKKVYRIHFYESS